MVSFKESMSSSKNYLKEEKSRWEEIELKYNTYINSTNDEQKIPKIIHQIWIGGEIPPTEKKLCEEWKKECERLGWKYILWGDKEVSEYEIKNKDLFDKTKSIGQKSDIIRLQILKEYGGIYLDTDFKFVRMFDEKILTLEFFASLTYDRKPIIMNSIMGSSKKNNFIVGLNEIGKISYHDAMEVIKTTGPYYITDKYFTTKIENTCIFPVSYFFPYSNKPHDKIKGNNYKEYIKDETNCVHLWNCSWMKKI